jgi:hypothetical protein
MTGRKIADEAAICMRVRECAGARESLLAEKRKLWSRIRQLNERRGLFDHESVD